MAYKTIVSGAALTAAGGPYYYAVPLSTDTISGMQLAWGDATSAFSATLYTTCQETQTVPVATTAAPDLKIWSSDADSVPIAPVAAGAAGSKVYHLGNVGAPAGLLRITPTANTSFSLYLWGK